MWQAGASVPWGRGGERLGYGLGWAVRGKNKTAGFARWEGVEEEGEVVVRSSLPRDDCFYVSHTGGAIGASSVLLIAPKPTRWGTTSTRTSSAQAQHHHQHLHHNKHQHQH